MYHWTANCSITVNRRFGVSLRQSTREVDSQEAGSTGRGCVCGGGGSPRPSETQGCLWNVKSEGDGGHGRGRMHAHVFYLQTLGAVQRFVSSHVGSFMLFNTRLTTFSRSLRALCSSSSDRFIFLLSCQVQATYVRLLFGGDCGV